MPPTTPRPSWALVAAAAASLLLGSCGAPSPDDAVAGATTPGPAAETTAASAPGPTTGTTTAAPAPSSAAPTGTPTAGPTGPAGPVELVTHTGTAADAAFAFELPATWAVDGEFTDVGGTVAVVGPDGAPVGHLSVLIAWGAECGPGCSTPPVVHLGDVPGSVPLSASGEFVVRSVAMDLTSAPEIRNAYGWPDSVRLVTSLTDAEVPPPTGMLPHVMHGLGSVETGVVAPNGVTYRTVIFSSVHDFATLEEAQEYAASEEHRQVQAMIASFRA